MTADRTESAPRTPIHGSFYIPWLDPVQESYVIDETIQTVDDLFYVPPSPIDYVALARSLDPRATYRKEVRKITMDSLVVNARIVGGPHRLPPKPILYADVEARERALRTDGTQYDGPSGAVSWYYRADIAVPLPIAPTSSVIRSKNSLPAGRAGEKIGVDPLETLGGGTTPTWRKPEATQSKKVDKRFDPIQKNKKDSPKKRREHWDIIGLPLILQSLLPKLSLNQLLLIN